MKYMNDFNNLSERIAYLIDGVLDFEYLHQHPQARFAVWQRYQNDPIFQEKLDQIMSIDPMFKTNFNSCFSEYLPQEQRSR